MNEAATSLDRLHDIVLPPDVPWWPLAPGWYGLLAVALVLLCWLTFRHWQSWRANAYRRAALRELAATNNAAGVAEILRRTALVIAPRADVAHKTGNDWLNWLESRGGGVLSAEIREDLTRGVYARTTDERDISRLRDYAARWISSHRPIATDTDLAR
jgi:hypothetical protein